MFLMSPVPVIRSTELPKYDHGRVHDGTIQGRNGPTGRQTKQPVLPVRTRRIADEDFGKNARRRSATSNYRQHDPGPAVGERCCCRLFVGASGGIIHIAAAGVREFTRD
jgi:hypothetical protein